MKPIKPIIFCTLILGVLSATPTDIFAFGGHRGHRGDFTAMEQRGDDASKYHTVLRHPEEGTSGFAANSGLNVKGPEMITLNNGREQVSSIDTGVLGVVHEDVVGVKHPESKKKSKAMFNCVTDPNSTGCK